MFLQKLRALKSKLSLTLISRLEYDAQRAVGSQRFQIQHGPAGGDLERSINPPERVDVTPDERIDLAAPYSVHQKRRVRQDFFPDNLLDPHVGDKTAGARPGKLAMSMAA